MKLPDHFQKRVGMTAAGVVCCALAVGFFKCSSFGVDPFQCFAQGVWAINSLWPEPGLVGRIVFLAVGVLVMCFASSLYMTSNLGVSVYDAIPIVISEKRKWPFRFVRIGCDLLCVAIGALAGLLPRV